MINCYPGAKRSIICIKDYIICLFASFCESIVLMRACIVCSFADGSKGNAEASARGIRARDVRAGSAMIPAGSIQDRSWIGLVRIARIDIRSI